MYLEIFLADFGEFRGISQKYLNFAGPRPCEISEALLRVYGMQRTHLDHGSWILDPLSLVMCFDHLSHET